jgi:hypothetical protein
LGVNSKAWESYTDSTRCHDRTSSNRFNRRGTRLKFSIATEVHLKDNNETGIGDGQKLQVHYVTQADVSSYVSLALKDAMRLVRESTGTRHSTCREVSLWSNRPDHLVVWHEGSHTPVLAVEIKMSMQETLVGSKLPETMTGQTFDYFMELRCLPRSGRTFCILVYANIFLDILGDQ